MNPSVCSWW